MHEQCHRQIKYLRIAVNSQENYDQKEILIVEEIVQIVNALVPFGITKVRLTGAEPLDRPGIVNLVKELVDISQIEEVSLTTNGLLLTKYARRLRRAGLKRVNINLSTIDPLNYKKGKKIDYAKVDIGIFAGWAFRLDPVKLNVNVNREITWQEICDLVDLSVEIPVHVRFIEQYRDENNQSPQHKYFTVSKIKKVIEDHYGLHPVTGITGNGPAVYYQVKGARGTIGFIAEQSSFCSTCSRMVLTPDGKLKPCLIKGPEFDLKSVLRQGSTNKEKVLQELIEKALLYKAQEAAK
ncbi:radical SAM protein [Bacillota bacterium LX-D]|nr:radical SAM protein [Bacillota bacterium LX-D]